MSLKDQLLKRGIHFRWASKAFNPFYQERTDAVEDIVKKDNSEVVKKLKKKFGMEE